MAIGIILAVVDLSFGIQPFLSPGHDAFEGLGYFVGGIGVLLGTLAALGAFLAARGRASAWIALALPLLFTVLWAVV